MGGEQPHHSLYSLPRTGAPLRFALFLRLPGAPSLSASPMSAKHSNTNAISIS
jgi:hypothetical protein